MGWCVGVAFVGSVVCGQFVRAQHVARVDVDQAERADVEALLNRKVTLDLKGVSLDRAIRAVSALAHATVLADQSAISRYDRPVSLHANDEPIRTVFERLLSGTTLRVVGRPHDRLVVTDAGAAIAVDSVPAGATITGRVVDSTTGRGIREATVKIAGTRLSAVTVDSGRFAVQQVPPGEYLVTVRVFGYRPGEHSVTVGANGRVSVRVALTPVTNLLKGVVTTATGLQERRNVGNDITVINADSVMRVAPVTSVTDLLATRVPGLTVQHTSGVPGAPSRIRLRGVGGGLVPGAENTSNDPIVIVDGVRIYARQSTTRDQNLAPSKGVNPGQFDVVPSFAPASALDQIDPNSIETIEVFKGPSATSQWGSDAGNGVIVITTKAGRAGPTQVSGSLSMGVNSMPGVYAAPGFYVFGRTSLLETSTSAICPAFPQGGGSCVAVDSVVRFQAANSPRLSPFGTGVSTTGSATVSGGSGTLTYSLTGSAARELGYLKMPALYQDLFRQGYGTQPPGWMKRPNLYKTWGTNATVGFVPTSGLQLTLRGSVTTSDQRQSSAQNDLATLSSTYLDTANLGPFAGDPSRPRVAVAGYVRRATSHDVTTQGSVSANWMRWARLPIRMTGGIQTLERADKQLLPFGFASSSFSDTLGAFSVGHGRSVVRTGDVSSTVPLAHLVTAGVGANVAITTTEDFSGVKDTLQAGITEPAALSRGTQRSSSLTTAGWFFEPRINFNSRLIASPGFRFDGGSGSNGSNAKSLSLFPKLNFSWITIDREGSSPLLGVLTTLRSRLAFGVAGVQPEPGWKTRLLTDGTAREPQTGALIPIDGVRLSALGNPTLHPERSREVEGGFDATLWSGRANLVVTAYQKMRTDAIQQVTTAPSVYGGQSYYVNVGRVRNTGVDVSADARLIETGALAWQVNATMSAYRNRLMTLYGDAPFFDVGDGTRLVQGYPIGGRWSRPILGYHDSNGDGTISLDEVAIADKPVFVGDGQPSVEIPFGTTISLWHGMIGITAQFDYKGGVTQGNAGSAVLLSNLYADTAASPGQQAIAIAAHYCVTGSNQFTQACVTGTDYGMIQTVSVLRFNTLSINYAVPRSFSARVGIPRMSVALQGSNLRLWTNYRGKDPDVNANIVGESLVDLGNAPLPRSWLLRIDLGN